MAQISQTITLPDDYDADALRRWFDLGLAIERGEYVVGDDKAKSDDAPAGNQGGTPAETDAVTGKRAKRTKAQIEADNAAIAAAQAKTLAAAATTGLLPTNMPSPGFTPPLQIPTRTEAPKPLPPMPPIGQPVTLQPVVPLAPVPAPAPVPQPVIVEPPMPTIPDPVGVNASGHPIFTHEQLKTAVFQIPDGAAKFHRIATKKHGWPTVESVPAEHLWYMMTEMFKPEAP